MVFKGLIAAASAVALVAAPTVAAAQTAAPTEIAPQEETAEGSELRGGFIIPLIALVAVILGILALTNDDDEAPESP